MINLLMVLLALASVGESLRGPFTRLLPTDCSKNRAYGTHAPYIVANHRGKSDKIVAFARSALGSKTRVCVIEMEDSKTANGAGESSSKGSAGEFQGVGLLDGDLFATDILGDMNFCLRSTDGALTGATRSKLLNSLTNSVFRAIVIGSASETERILGEFDDFRIKVGQCTNNGTTCDFETNKDVVPVQPEAINGEAADASKTLSTSRLVTAGGKELDLQSLTEKEDMTLAQIYIDALEALLLRGEIRKDDTATSSSSPSTSTHSEKEKAIDISDSDSDSDDSSNGGKRMKKMKKPPQFFGSMYDRGYRRLLTILKDAGCRFQEPSGTGRPLSPADQNVCLSLLDSMLPPDEVSVTRELNKISNIVSRAMLYGGKREKEALAQTIREHIPSFVANPAFKDTDENSQEVTFLSALAYLLDFGLGPAQEQITGQMSNTGAFGESVITGGIGSVATEDEGSLRLYDAYTNAFQRVVEVCLGEIASRRLPQSTAQDDDFLLNFVIWEQSLRRNLTADMWAPNPQELAGEWELIDISGMGALSTVMVNDPDVYFGMKKGVTVSLQGDGKVEVDFPTSIGKQWYFKPGPAHLDTCEFTIRSEKDRPVELKYTGFIDRGQRIESRFSKQAIKMTGRVVSSIAGELQGSCRFIMAKRS